MRKRFIGGKTGRGSRSRIDPVPVTGWRKGRSSERDEPQTAAEFWKSLNGLMVVVTENCPLEESHVRQERFHSRSCAVPSHQLGTPRGDSEPDMNITVGHHDVADERRHLTPLVAESRTGLCAPMAMTSL